MSDTDLLLPFAPKRNPGKQMQSKAGITYPKLCLLFGIASFVVFSITTASVSSAKIVASVDNTISIAESVTQDQPEDAQESKDSKTPDENSTESNEDATGEPNAPEAGIPKQTTGFIVQIPMPITQEVATRTIASIGRILEKSGEATAGVRPILILELDNRNGSNGIGSNFEDCLKIGRFLTSSKLNRFRTIAYLPGPPSVMKELFDDGQKPESSFQGHAVLIPLSCEEIVMHKDASLGNAGIDEEVLDKSLIASYESISEKRRVIPVEMALSMLDKNRVVFRDEIKSDGVKYVDRAEHEQLEKDGKIVSSTTISDLNNFGYFTSSDLQSYRLIRHRVDSRRELADRYNLPATALEGDPSLGENWSAVKVAITGTINDRMIRWIENALSTQVENTDTNLIIIEIDSTGGEPEAAMRLANRLSEYDSSKVRTVAYIPNRARGAASIIALGCDHIVMKSDAEMGGIGRPEITPDDLIGIKEALKEVAKRKETTWSLAYGLIDSSFEVKRVKNNRTGRFRLVSDEEKQTFNNPEQWKELQVVDLSTGITGESGDNLGVVRSLVEDFEEFKSFYQLSEDPQILEPTLADQWLEKFAHQLASPQISFLVLFGAIFLLSMEFSNPGLSVPGFLSAILWMLFFWSQFFDGNASVLEILMFIVGVIFILIEFFVLPGFGIFGIGGGLLMTASIILAVQTFVLPRTPEEVNTMTVSLITFLGACSGFFVALFVFRHYMTKLPMFRGMSLDPSLNEGDHADRQIKESLVDFSSLVGENGMSQTKLMPSGKAIIGRKLYNVISDGRMIDKDAKIVVTSVTGNRIVVSESDG